MPFLYCCLSNEFSVILFEIVPVRSNSPVTAVRYNPRLRAECQ